MGCAEVPKYGGDGYEGAAAGGALEEGVEEEGC